MAVTSSVAIGNMALSHIGNSQAIEDLYPSELTQEAFQVTQWYDHARLELLESFDWNFARSRVALSEHADDPPSGQWSYRYEYPSDCVRALELENPVGRQADKVAYEVEYSGNEKTILTNQEDAVLVYTKNIENTALFSRKFIVTLSYLIAAYIAFPLTGNIQVQESMGQKFARSFRSATGVNAQEGREDTPPEAEWISGRS